VEAKVRGVVKVTTTEQEATLYSAALDIAWKHGVSAQGVDYGTIDGLMVDGIYVYTVEIDGRDYKVEVTPA
jgi:hypothetical protein